MISLENSNYRVEIDPLGAQLTHLYRLADNYDYIWNGDAWPKHAPILFPAIGRSNNDKYTFAGQIYEMPQHGFAADQMFEVLKQTDTSTVLTLLADENTKQMYPFAFELQVTFSLSDTGLIIDLNVINHDNKPMSYSVGYHPAFNVPFVKGEVFEDYAVEFTGNNNPLEVFEIIKTPAPYRTGKVEPFDGLEDNHLDLTHAKFEKGLRIITNNDLEAVTLKSKLTGHAIKLALADFSNVCLWTKEDMTLPFLCIEPFNGLPDVLGSLVDLDTKEGNLTLLPNTSRNANVTINLS